MKFVNSSIKFERKTRTPDHSNPMQNPKTPQNHKAPKFTKKPSNIDRMRDFYDHELLMLLKNDPSDSSFSLFERDKEKLWYQMQYDLMKKKAEVRKFELLALKSQLKQFKAQNNHFVFEKNEKIDEKLNFIRETHEKMIGLKFKYKEKSNENRKLKEKLIKIYNFLLNDEKLLEKSISLEQNLPSCNGFNENFSKNPIFDEYFQSSSSNLPKESKEKPPSKNEKPMEEKNKAILLEISTKVAKLRSDHKIIKEKAEAFSDFFQKNAEFFKENLSIFLNNKLKLLTERNEVEKKEYIGKINEESIVKLQSVKEQYETYEKEMKSKLEQANSRNEQISHAYTTYMNEKTNELNEKNDELQSLKEETEKMKGFPAFNNEKKKYVNIKGKNIGEQGNLPEQLKNMEEKIEKMKSFYEEKFYQYEKKVQEMLVEQEKLKKMDSFNEICQKNHEKNEEKIEKYEKIEENEKTEKKDENIKKNEKKIENLEEKCQKSYEFLKTADENDQKLDLKPNFLEKNEKNTFLLFDEVQSKHLQKNFDKNMKALKLKYEESMKTLREENLVLLEEKEKMMKESKEISNLNNKMQVEKLNLEEKLKKTLESLKDKEYQILVKNTVAAKEMNNYGNSPVAKEFKKAMSPLIIAQKLNVKGKGEEKKEE